MLHDQVSDCNGLGDGVLGNLAVPFADDLVPGQAVAELIENNPHHDARALESRLAAADSRISHNVAAEFDPGLAVRSGLHAHAPDYASDRIRLQAVGSSPPKT